MHRSEEERSRVTVITSELFIETNISSKYITDVLRCPKVNAKWTKIFSPR